jgi:hypothetical protein
MHKTERFGKYIITFYIDFESPRSREVIISLDGEKLVHHCDFNLKSTVDENVADLQSIAYEKLRDLFTKYVYF